MTTMQRTTRCGTTTFRSAIALVALAAGACADRPEPTALAPDAAARRLDVAPTAGASTPGNVYAMTNDPQGNRIMVFMRGADGTLTPGPTVATGGNGSGQFENSANGLVLGEQSPDNLGGTHKFLFATNTGSSSISVFKVFNDGTLELTDVEPSGGTKPISVTAHDNTVYVLNEGNGNSCTGSAVTPPNISGFRLRAEGELTPIPGSTRPVSGGATSGCAQVSFNKDGRVLVVTERGADVISTYLVARTGEITAGPITNQTTGNGPFGFTFTQRGELVTTENTQGAPGQGAVASYEVTQAGLLVPLSPSVRNGRNDTCWIVITDDNRYAYTTNFQSGDISLYRITPEGVPVLQSPVAGQTGIEGSADQTLSADSRFLYARNAVQGTLHVFAVDRQTGAITPIQVLSGLPPVYAIGLAAR